MSSVLSYSLWIGLEIAAFSMQQEFRGPSSSLGSQYLLNQMPKMTKKVRSQGYEFDEVGMTKQLGFASPADLMDLYPQFYFKSLSAHLQTAIRYLNVTSSGRRWIASLYSNVFRAERELRLSATQR